MAANSQPFVGIDVSGARLGVACRDDVAAVRSFANDPAGIGQVIELLRGLRPQLAVVESTGKLEQPLLLALLDAGVPVARVDPKRVRLFAYGIGQLAKTDARSTRGCCASSPSWPPRAWPSASRRRGRNSPSCSSAGGS